MCGWRIGWNNTDSTDGCTRTLAAAPLAACAGANVRGRTFARERMSARQCEPEAANRTHGTTPRA
ncbi:hypothetical protein DF037_26220 [Burkholderia contaminans]|uniref:Uncharacterized protein n=1 Tax=Burkholderia contaminans TaxID=488447 RepID=A0A3N8QGJ6_9BURK|nr:hypothetical protein DF037_26220 [Burkholderia contaminans]